MMNKQYVWMAAAVAALVGGQALAQESPWLVRLRAVQLDMANENSTAVAGLGANNKTIGEVDVSYFFTPNIAAELILTVPQRQIVRADSGDLGGFTHLPPTLSLQYHFTGMQGFKPYVGLGVNYTKITGVNIASGAYTLESSSTGGAAQVGVDFPLDRKWSLNVDIKKVYIRSDVFTAAGANAGTLKLDPTLFGVGIGYRF
jgi:outer membrane protein